MKPVMLLAALAGLAGAARANTQAVSREAVLYVMPKPATVAVSREATLYVQSRAPTAAVSREATLYVATVSTQAVSREASLFVNYRLPDLIRALRLAAGFETATPDDKQLLNIATKAPSGTVLDILDAAAISIRIGRPELVP